MSVYEQVTQALAKAKKLGEKAGLNCIAELDPTAMQQAKELDARDQTEISDFWGTPVLIKDNIDVKGLHTTAGSLALDDNIATEDAPVIRNLRKNGAVILGKTNMTEFANYTTNGMPGGYSSRGGQVIHAANPKLSPAGSSSGSAVAVAAGIVSAAVGTDTSFSIIACAQENGICGLKPPVGTLSSEGIIPISKTLDSAGAMAKNFTDTLRLYSAMREDPLPELQATDSTTLKIAVNTANWNMVSPGQNRFRRRATRLLKRNGASISKIRQMPTPFQSVIMKYEFKAHLEEYLCTSSASRKTLKEIIEYYESNPEIMMKYGNTLLKAALEETSGSLQDKEYLAAMEERNKSIIKVREELADYDAVIVCGPTNIMHFCGLPSVTIAGSQTNLFGVRRGLILYGVDEYRLYRAALAIEKIIGN
ncbi:MAG: hypothetical protein IKL04_09025 [Lachnospiraceae bacterium]|nr:hypothetical protein [Lachnospiraceae bacterium]